MSISVSTWGWTLHINLSGFNWDRNPCSVPLKTEDMVRSGEASVWFNPTSHVLVRPFAYKKLCENVSAFRFKCGRVADEDDALIEKTIARSTNPN
jgi:hypothetical protein